MSATSIAAEKRAYCAWIDEQVNEGAWTERERALMHRTLLATSLDTIEQLETLLLAHRAEYRTTWLSLRRHDFDYPQASQSQAGDALADFEREVLAEAANG